MTDTKTQTTEYIRGWNDALDKAASSFLNNAVIKTGLISLKMTTNPQTTLEPEEMALRTAHGISVAHELATRKRLNDYLIQRRKAECRIRCDRVIESEAPAFIKFIAKAVRP